MKLSPETQFGKGVTFDFAIHVESSSLRGVDIESIVCMTKQLAALSTLNRYKLTYCKEKHFSDCFDICGKISIEIVLG
jgi:hypothetical protein